ncbi:hypothetical protein AVEN_145361-1 [Araneus ventricosus]|uniref:Uncharacterized protein n=1 Tax=Araneus ventricosus TaxID=182803 RepID=A0A4Y2S414_ARAVE|nr:hypothetical protein AVEN_145361-1 [Araneus ventricosus]
MYINGVEEIYLKQQWKMFKGKKWICTREKNGFAQDYSFNWFHHSSNNYVCNIRGLKCSEPQMTNKREMKHESEKPVATPDVCTRNCGTDLWQHYITEQKNEL